MILISSRFCLYTAPCLRQKHLQGDSNGESTGKTDKTASSKVRRHVSGTTTVTSARLHHLYNLEKEGPLYHIKRCKIHSIQGEPRRISNIRLVSHWQPDWIYHSMHVRNGGARRLR